MTRNIHSHDPFVIPIALAHKTDAGPGGVRGMTVWVQSAYISSIPFKSLPRMDDARGIR